MNKISYVLQSEFSHNVFHPSLVLADLLLKLGVFLHQPLIGYSQADIGMLYNRVVVWQVQGEYRLEPALLMCSGSNGEATGARWT